MAKFVEWANSLLCRFEDQVTIYFFYLFTQFSTHISNFPRCQEKSINLLQVIFLLILLSRYFQLPYKKGNSNIQGRTGMEQSLIEQSLIQISRYRFSLVIVGLNKMLQRVNEIVRIIFKFFKIKKFSTVIFLCSINRQKSVEFMMQTDQDMTQ